MRITDRQIKVLKAFKNPSYWKPVFSKISKDLGVPVSTVFEMHQRFGVNFIMDVKVEAPKELKKLLGVFEPIK